jgi:hypothetical protein
MRHVVQQAQLAQSGVAEAAPGGVGEQLPVGVAVVGGGRHRGQVAPPFPGFDRSAGQLRSGTVIRYRPIADSMVRTWSEQI